MKATKMLNRFFNFQAKNVTSGALILTLSYFFSALLGLMRDRLLASRFGAGLELDVYFAAFRIPDFVYNILILGGITAAFLPLFSEYLNKKNDEVWKMVNYTLNAFLVFLIFISLLLFIFAPWLLKWIFPGFGPEHLKLAVPLVRILLLSPIIFGISSIISGILQYFGRFLIYGLAPVLYNLGIILGIIFLSPRFGIFGVGMGVILGALLYLAIQIPSAKNCGYFYKSLFDFKYPAVKRIFQLMFPRVFGVAAQQINLLAMVAIASLIGTGAISIFNFSNTLQSFPLGIIGAPFAVAVFPALSRAWASGKKKEFLDNFYSVFNQVIFLIVPVSIFIFMLRNQIVRIIYQTGKFGPEAAQITSTCLGIFAFSIFAQSLIHLLVRAFFSFQDTKTPTLIAILTISFNIVLAFLFAWLMGFENYFSTFFEKSLSLIRMEGARVISLPLSFSAAAILQFILLLVFLKRKIADFKIKEIRNSFRGVFLAGLLMVFTIYYLLYFSAKLLVPDGLFSVLIQTISAGLFGALIYVFAAFLLRLPELKTLKSSILRRGFNDEPQPPS